MQIHTLKLHHYAGINHKELLFPEEKSLVFIYGDNEAGKSTVRGALGDFLYGIENISLHQHFGSKKLQIDCCFSHGGQRYELSRKADKRGLQSLDGEPRTSAPMLPLLPERGIFENLYSVQHQEIKRGGQSLFHQKGNFRDAILSASVGLNRMQDIQKALTDRAQSLYSKRGKANKIPQLLALHKELQTQIREKSISADYWRTLELAVEVAREKESDAAIRHETIVKQIAHLELLARITPMMEHLRLVQLQLQNYTSSKTIDEAQLLEIERLAAAYSALSEDIALIEKQNSEESMEFESIALNTEFLALETDILSLAQHIERVKLATTQLPDLLLEREKLDLEVTHANQAILSGLSTWQGQATTLPKLPLLQERAQDLQSAISQLKETEEQLQDSKEEQIKYELQLQHLNAPAGLKRISLTLEQYTHDLTEIEAALQQVQTNESKHQEELQRLQVNFFNQSPTFHRISLPNKADIHAKLLALTKLTTEKESLEKVVQAHKEQIRQIEERIATLCSLTKLRMPSELDAARLRRNHILSEYKAHPNAENFNLLREAIEESDSIADNLFVHASDYQEHKSLSFDLSKQRVQASIENERLDALNCEIAAFSRELSQLASVLQQPLSSFDQALEAIELCDLYLNIKDQLRVNQSEIERLSLQRESLLDQITDLTGSTAKERRGLSGQSVQVILAQFRDLEQRESLLRHSLEQSRLRTQTLALKRDAVLDRLNSEKDRWYTFLDEFNLPKIGEVDAVIDLYQHIAHYNDLLERGNRLAADIKHHQGSLEKIAERAQCIARKVGHELSTHSLLAFLQYLSAELTEQRALQLKYEGSKKKLLHISQEKSRLKMQLGSINANLERLARANSADSIEALLKLIPTSKHFLTLKQDESKTLAQLISLVGSHEQLAQLQEELKQLSMPELETQLAKYQLDLETSKARLRDCHKALGIAEQNLDQAKASQGSVTAMQDDENLCSDLSLQVREYLRQRIAADIMRRSVAKYIDQKRGPILKKANNFFSELTSQRYTDLRLEDFTEGDFTLGAFDRQSGVYISPEAMSSGTCDQLYMALRFAAIELQLEKQGSIPIILDDVLLTFDDSRAANALQVLEQISRKTQVLYFTHEMHIVEQARELLKEEVFEIVEL